MSKEALIVVGDKPVTLFPWQRVDVVTVLNHVWTRWFLTIREKVNIISASLVNLGSAGGTGFMAKDGDNWTPRTIEDTAYTDVTNGDGISGKKLPTHLEQTLRTVAIRETAE